MRVSFTDTRFFRFWAGLIVINLSLLGHQP
jgi:hypothetical protein